MSETSIVRGRVEVQPNLVHGALNTIVTIFGEEEDWQFKQFVSQEQLESFARENDLVIAQKE